MRNPTAREVAREIRRQESNDTLKGLLTLALIGIGGYYWLTSNGHTSATAKNEPVPYAQSAFVASLDDYHNQYSKALSNKNDVQQNRIHDARRKDLLCQTDPNVENWIVKVDRVNTDWSNDRHRVWVVLQVSRDVWFNSEIVEEAENKEMFETIANLKQGDKIRVSGILRREGDKKSLGDYMREERVKAEGTGHCIHEKSATQWGGMTTPEFGIILSSIGDYKAAASTTTGADADGVLTAAATPSPASPFKPVKRPKVAAQPQTPNQPDQKGDAELARRNPKQTPDQVGGWKSAIVAKLGEHKQFPVGAPADGGKAQVSFELDREGKVIASRIVNSSGSSVLDQEALDMLQRASPLPAPPDSLQNPVELTVPVRFSKRASR